MNVLFNKVEATPSVKKDKVSFTDEEKAVTKTVVLATIQELRGVPFAGDELVVQPFIGPVKKACLAAGAAPGKHAEKGRSWGAYAHLVRQAYKALVEEAKKAEAKEVKAG